MKTIQEMIARRLGNRADVDTLNNVQTVAGMNRQRGLNERLVRKNQDGTIGQPDDGCIGDCEMGHDTYIIGDNNAIHTGQDVDSAVVSSKEVIEPIDPKSEEEKTYELLPQAKEITESPKVKESPVKRVWPTVLKWAIPAVLAATGVGGIGAAAMMAGKAASTVIEIVDDKPPAQSPAISGSDSDTKYILDFYEGE